MKPKSESHGPQNPESLLNGFWLRVGTQQETAKFLRLDQAANMERNRPLGMHLQLLIAIKRWTHRPSDCSTPSECTKQRVQLNTTCKYGNAVLVGIGMQRSIGGIVYVVNKKWSPHIISYQFCLPRISELLLQLDFIKTLEVIQSYVSMTSDDDEVETFCDKIESTLIVSNTVVMDNFSAKFGCEGKTAKKYIGKYGTGKQNDKGDRVRAMAKVNKLFVSNTWFWKKQDGNKLGLRRM